MASTPDESICSSSDRISITPHVLQAASPTYYKVAQDIINLQQTLVSNMQLATGDMFLFIEFVQLASKLEHLQTRINTAMQCAAKGLDRIGIALEVVAEDATGMDQQISDAIKRMQNDPHRQNPRIVPSITVHQDTPLQQFEKWVHSQPIPRFPFLPEP